MTARPPTRTRLARDRLAGRAGPIAPRRRRGPRRADRAAATPPGAGRGDQRLSDAPMVRLRPVHRWAVASAVAAGVAIALPAHLG
ncbi:MAG: hypothetical protein AVDCRST_MAG49-505, partial [uncultured Thermomicrobiales bacterium]